MRRSRFVLRSIVLVVALIAVSVPVLAQATASALIREDDKLPGSGGQQISSLSTPVVNHNGGYAITVNTDGPTSTISNIWGNATGGPGTVLISEGTFGDLEQTSFEAFHGLSNDGQPSYSASSTNLVTGATGLDGVWVGPTIVLNEEDPIPTIPGQFSTFNSRPGITADGQPYWVGGFSPTQGSSTQNRAIFFGFGIQPVIMGGDSVVGVAEPIETGSSNIDFDYRFSALGTSYIGQVLVDTGSNSDDGVVVIDGAAVFSGGGVLREGQPVPASIGGLPGEEWDNFDFFGITEGGTFLITGDTNAPSSTDEFVAINGEIVLREGDAVSTEAGDFVLDGSIEGGYLNEDGDWVVIWDIEDAGGTNVEALLLNGEVILAEGDAVDLDGDGEVEPASILRNFTGLAALVIGDRDAMGRADIYFTADIDVNGTSTTLDDIEGFFRIGGDAAGIMLPLDIKPGSCPNPFNPGSNGVLPMSLLGTVDFDVNTVDLATVGISRGDGNGGTAMLLDGPPGPSPSLEDKGTPIGDDAETCDCDGELGDGIVDLTLFFDSSMLANELGLSADAAGESVELVVSGTLLDGTPFEASDCVSIVPPGNEGGMEGAGSESGDGIADLGMSAPAVRSETRAEVEEDTPRLRQRQAAPGKRASRSR